MAKLTMSCFHPLQSFETRSIMGHGQTMSLSRAIVAALIFVSASPAVSVPPPPPKQADLKSLQSYILGLNHGRPDLYQSALADDLNVIVGDQLAAKSKSEWMKSVFARFEHGFNQNVTVEHVYYGGVQLSAGPFENQAILIERANRIFGGDCCIFYRVETLSFRGDGLISKIKRSAELDLELKPDGHVPWEQPGTQ